MKQKKESQELPLTRTSQLVGVLCALLLGVALSPLGSWGGLMIGGAGGGGNDAGTTRSTSTARRIVVFVHVLSHACWLGAQVWVTFVSGKSAA